MEKRYISNQQDLLELCEQIKSSTWLAVDTEFIRETSYYPVFCLLQVSDGKVSACIDPLQIDDLQPIADLLLSESIIKVFHAAFQDLEIFYHAWGQVPSPLFDTQLAATLTGHGEQLGYAPLVQKVLGVSLPKDQSRTDWQRRPLDEKQLDYAHDDVIYLGRLYEKLSHELAELQRNTWLEDEYAALANPATYQVQPLDAWKKVKGRQHLKGNQLAVLQQLSAWREEKAVQANKPRRWILKDEVLVDLSRRAPTKAAQLEKIRGLEKATIRKNGQHLLDIIASARQIPAAQWPLEEKRPARLNPQEEALCDLLMCSLRLLCDEHAISAAAIASRKDLEKLIQGREDMALMHGWRRKLAGDALQAVLQHRLLPGWNAAGRLELLKQ